MKDYHPILFPYAYNILGSAQDARDAVQDVLYKYLATPKEGIENEKNYLIRSVINQAINLKKSKKKIVSDDGWLPEPIATEAADDNINLSDIISYSLMILMERLNPKERAAFILKEGFGYSHEEIASLLSSSIENSRKLLSRAKTKLDATRTGPQQPPAPFPTELLEKFITAIRGGDIKTLETLLTEDITYSADGGSKIRVVSKFTVGRTDVANLLILVNQRFQRNTTIVPTVLNHQPAYLFYRQEKLFMCQVFGFSLDGRINQINSVIDPEKLRAIAG